MTFRNLDVLHSNHSQDRENIIADALQGFLSEIRLIDVEHLISFATLQMFNHIADLVNSAAEHFFSPGFVTFGHGCAVTVGWNHAPIVSIDLIVHLGWGRAYVSVKMQQDGTEVRLDYFSVDHPSAFPQCYTSQLAHTISRNSFHR